MLDADLRRYLIVRRVLNQISESFLAWHQEQRRTLIATEDPLYWTQRLADLTPEQHAEVAALNERIPTAADIAAIEDVIARLGTFTTLASEDALYLADSRSKLVSCLLALRDGELRDAWQWASDSHERLTWLVHGRKRETVRAGRHPSAEVMDELDEVSLALEEIIAALRRGAAA